MHKLRISPTPMFVRVMRVPRLRCGRDVSKCPGLWAANPKIEADEDSRLGNSALMQCDAA
jgi:hypothetical protein